MVGLYFPEYGSHEYLADKPAAVINPVFVAEAIQGLLFFLVEEDGYLMFAGRLLHE